MSVWPLGSWSSFPFVGKTGIPPIHTKNVLQIVASDERREADLDWRKLMERLSEETASRLRPEQ